MKKYISYSETNQISLKYVSWLPSSATAGRALQAVMFQKQTLKKNKEIFLTVP